MTFFTISFRETFLCNWDSSYLRRPPQSVPRDVQEWIQQVFITKRFKGEPKKEPSPDHIKVIVLPKEQPVSAMCGDGMGRYGPLTYIVSETVSDIVFVPTTP